MKPKVGNDLPRCAGARSQRAFERAVGDHLPGLGPYDGGTADMGASLTFLGL